MILSKFVGVLIIIRYPFHFHVMGDLIGRGFYVNESSFHHGYQRCLTVHGTSGIAVKNNVGFNVTGTFIQLLIMIWCLIILIGHCYFLEEGSETWNTFDHNLGAWVNPGSMVPTDNKPSIFWITNPVIINSFSLYYFVGVIINTFIRIIPLWTMLQ